MYKLPSDEELFAHLPGTGEWAQTQYQNMSDQYDVKKTQVAEKLPPLNGWVPPVDPCRDAMGQWIMSYLKQRKPIEVFPAYQSGSASEGPCMIDSVSAAVEKLSASRENFESSQVSAILKNLIKTVFFFDMSWLCYLGTKAGLDGAYPAMLEGWAGIAVGILLAVGVVFFGVSFWPCAAGAVIAMLKWVDRDRAEEKFVQDVAEQAPEAYLYLRFCELWTTAEGKPMPPEMMRSMIELQKAVNLYNQMM